MRRGRTVCHSLDCINLHSATVEGQCNLASAMPLSITAKSFFFVCLSAPQPRVLSNAVQFKFVPRLTQCLHQIHDTYGAHRERDSQSSPLGDTNAR